MDDIGLDDESFSIVIIGGGPHALAALAALHDAGLQFRGDKIGTVCVIDPGSRFMQSWNKRFDALEIDHLRSPAFAHPVAFEPTALVDFAVREGRTSELVDAPVDRWLPTTDLSSHGLLKNLPSSALFRDFCASLEAKLPHRWLSGAATSVCKDSSTGEFRVHFKATDDQRERKVVARAVLLATGPASKWNVPAPFEPHLASPLVIHTEELLLAEGKGALREEVTRRCPGESAPPVLVIGGGITAAQAALAVFRAGHQVVLRSRRPLQTRAFDVASEWLDVRRADRLRYEFLSLPVNRRREAVRQATSGGSVPATYIEELCRLAQETAALRLEVDDKIDRSLVSMDPGGEHVVVNGETFAMVILATGVVTAPACSPLYRSVQELLGAPIVDGLPRVDNFLRWASDEDLFVLGASAVLELGPGGGNLLGAMRGARVVSHELHSLMWKPFDGRMNAGPARSINTSKYATLLDGSEPEIDVLVRRLRLSPKEEHALRKASKHKKSSKGLGGGQVRTDPMGNLKYVPR